MIENYNKTDNWEVGQYCVFKYRWTECVAAGQGDSNDEVHLVKWYGAKITKVNENGTYALNFGWDFCVHTDNIKAEDMLASKEDIPADNIIKIDKDIDVKDWIQYELEKHRKYKFEVKQKRKEKKQRHKDELKKIYMTLNIFSFQQK